MTLIVQTIQWRRGTAAVWTQINPVLFSGEPGYETDTGKWKLGDGVTAWNTLAYQGVGGGAAAWGGITGTLSAQADLQAALDAKANTAALATKLDDLSAGLGDAIATVSADGTLLGRAAHTIATLIAYVVARANHTGSQLAITISDFANAAIAAVTWSTITGKPSTFDPSAHASSHAAAGSDPLTGYEVTSAKGQPSGYASLDSGGQIPQAQIPAIAITEKLADAANQAAMLALVGQVGDWTIRTDTGLTWIITGNDPTQLSSWTALSYPGAPVTSVAGRVGAVTLSAADITDSSAAGRALLTAADADAQKAALAIVATNISDFAANVRSTVLTGLSLATSQTIAATDTVLQSLGYLQAQITAAASALAANVRATTLAGLSTAAGTVVTASHTILEAIGFLQNQVTARLPLAGGTMSGAIACADNEIQRPCFVDSAHKTQAKGSISGAQTIDLTAGNSVTATASGAITWTFSNPSPSGTECAIFLTLTNGGVGAQTWPASVDWDATAGAPTLTASGVDKLLFVTNDAGTIWYGFLCGKGMT